MNYQSQKAYGKKSSYDTFPLIAVNSDKGYIFYEMLPN